MLFTTNYLILDELPDNNEIKHPLCILKINLATDNINKLSNLINNNPNTEFWLATNNSSKKIIDKANELGIKNIINLPIDENLINKFFNKITPQNNHSQISDIDLSESKVAIVDDNDMNIKLLTEILSDLNIKIYSYNSPEEAIKNIETEKFDLFMLDILMPNISGFDLAKRIKKTELNSTTPIVFVSAMVDIESKLNGYELGAYSYIEKPYNIELVKTQVYNILKKQLHTKTINTQKENFVAMLTHDLKSPINAEINALELLIQKKFGEISDCQHEIIGSVLNSVKYMKHITDQILSFYKCKNSYIKLNLENTIFEEIVHESISSMKFLIEEKKQKVHLKSTLHKKQINIDVIEIKRLICNLLSNAIEYTPEGSEIWIDLKQDKSSFIFSIKDSGYGIAPENLANIFDEYMSLAKKQKRVGFGLGLNICKKIVEAHGGNINIESELGKGTTITFAIPK